MPSWPNGRGTRPRSWTVRVRIAPRARTRFAGRRSTAGDATPSPGSPTAGGGWPRSSTVRVRIAPRVRTSVRSAGPTPAGGTPALMAQWTAHLITDQGVAGSNPARGTHRTWRSLRRQALVAQKDRAAEKLNGVTAGELRMHRDRASGVEDHGTGNLSPRQGSALPHRRQGDVGSSPTQGTASHRHHLQARVAQRKSAAPIRRTSQVRTLVRALWL